MMTVKGPEGPSYLIEVRTFWAYLVGTATLFGMASVMSMLWFIQPSQPIVQPMVTATDYESAPIYDKSQYIERIDEH